MPTPTITRQTLQNAVQRLYGPHAMAIAVNETYYPTPTGWGWKQTPYLCESPVQCDTLAGLLQASGRMDKVVGYIQNGIDNGATEWNITIITYGGTEHHADYTLDEIAG